MKDWKDCRLCKHCKWRIIDTDYSTTPIPFGCKLGRLEYDPDGFTDCDEYIEFDDNLEEEC